MKLFNLAMMGTLLFSTQAYSIIEHGVFSSLSGRSTLQLNHNWGDCRYGDYSENYYTTLRIFGREFPGEMSFNCESHRVRVMRAGKSDIVGRFNPYTKVLHWHNVTRLGQISFQLR